MMESRRPGRRRAAARVRLAGLLALVAACGDGGTGTPDNPVPSIQNLDPVSLLQYADSTVLTVTGTGFVAGAVVRVDGVPRLTQFVSGSQVTAMLPPALLEQAGTLEVSVFNPAPGGGESARQPLTVAHRLPGLMLMQPSEWVQGDTAITLEVLGQGFAPASVVRWNGEDRPTTFLHRSTLRVRISAADLAVAGTAQVTVVTPAPGGGASRPLPFQVRVRPNPVPTVATLAPDSLLVETDGTFVLTGSGFMTGTTVSVGGVLPAPTIVSDTELRFTLTADNVPNAGFAQVFVTNPGPGGGMSNLLGLRVYNPPPVLTALSPAQARIGADSLTLRLTGSGFVRASEVRVGPYARAARRVSPTELEVLIDAFELSRYDTIPIRVINYQPGGGTSAELRLAVVNPAPVATALTPAQVDAGGDSLVVRVTGSAFSPLSVVHFRGSPRPTRFVRDTELEAVLTTPDLAEAGAFPVSVVTPPPGGGVSEPLTLTLAIAAPVLTELPSSGASAGGPGFQLTVHGRGFLRGSVVRWNGQPRATNFISSTRLEANVTTADVASPGTAAVTVETPGGGTSAARQVTIRAVPSAAFTSTRTVALQVADLAYAAAHDRVYAAIPAEAGARQNSVVALDPRTGEITGSVLLGGDPDQLAVSDDGSTLWVSLRATGQVRRLALPDLTPGTLFSLGSSRVADMRVMPGHPGTLAIALHNNCCSPSHDGVAIYDNGVRRARATRDHTGSNTIAFGESAAVLYGRNTEYEYGFRTMRVTAEGVEEVRASWVGHHGFRIYYAAGRVYINGEQVVDAGRHEAVGTFTGAGAIDMVPDAALGRAFFLTYNDQLAVYDLNTFQRIDQVSLPGLSPSRRRLLRWGTDGLVYNDAENVYIVRTPIAGS